MSYSTFIKAKLQSLIIEMDQCHWLFTRKHCYQLNYTRAIHICRFFLSIRKRAPPDVESLISRELLPVRPGRSDPRKVKPQATVSFLYRVA